MAAESQNQLNTKQEDSIAEPSLDEMLEPQPLEGFDNFGSRRLPNYEGNALGVQGVNLTPLMEYDQRNAELLEPELTGEAISEFEDILDKAEREVMEEYDGLSQDDKLVDTAAVYGSVGNMTATQGSDLEAMIVINYSDLFENDQLNLLGESGPTPQELAGMVAGKVEGYENRLPKKLTGGLDARVTTLDVLDSAITGSKRSDKPIPFEMGGPIKDGIDPKEVNCWDDLKDQRKCGMRNRFINFREKMGALYKGSVIPLSYSGEALKQLDEGISIIQDSENVISEAVYNNDEFTIERLCAQYVKNFDEPKNETRSLANFLSRSENYPLNDAEKIAEKIEEVNYDD
jgi:hypothetical protein